MCLAAMGYNPSFESGRTANPQAVPNEGYPTPRADQMAPAK